MPFDENCTSAYDVIRCAVAPDLSKRSLRRQPCAIRVLCGCLLTIALALQSGCKVGPDHSSPPAPLAPRWKHIDENGANAEPACLGYWWAEFNDPILEGFIARAVALNPDLQQAVFRVLETRSRRSVVKGGLFPTADATAASTYRKISGNGSPFSVTSTSGFSFNSLGFDSAWELDFWGKFRRAIESADAETAVAAADYNDVLVTLLGDVAATYVQIRMFQARIAVARENETIQKKTLTLVEAKHQAGIAKKLDVAQARTNFYTTVSSIPPLLVRLEQSENRLSVLMGQPPGNLQGELGQNVGIPVATSDLAIGIPADLLRRRPDVRSAERAVAAESARIGVAVAELYPQFSLTGTITVDSIDVTKLFNPESIAHKVGPSVKWNILNFGRLRNAIRAQRARHQQAIFTYVSTVLSAAEEVENALAAFVQEHDRMNALASAAEAAQESVRLSGLYYQEGFISFQTVLDSQRSLLSLQEQLQVSRATVAISRITIYKALGGGWEPGTNYGTMNTSATTNHPETIPQRFTRPGINPPELIQPEALHIETIQPQNISPDPIQPVAHPDVVRLPRVH